MLQVNGKTMRPLISRLVLTAFDRAATAGEQTCHVNQDAMNNALWNLRWGSQSDNWDDSKRHGTRRRSSKLPIKDVSALRARMADGESASAVAPDFGISDTQARNIARSDQWQPEPNPEWPLSNCWLGVSAENQHWADERIPLLLRTPAAHRWASLEPLLGRLNLDAFLYKKLGWHPNGPERLDWVVVGGESGPGHRAVHLRWILSIADQCFGAKVPYFGKQASGARPNAPLPGSIARRELPW